MAMLSYNRCTLYFPLLLLLHHGSLAKPSGSVEDSTKTSICGNQTPGYTTPSGDITIQYGNPLNITCTISSESLQNVENLSNDLSFVTKNGSMVDRKYISIVNETSINMYIEHPEKTISTTYVCMLNSTFICNNVVAVGVPVQNITDFKCISYNMENLTCTWTGPNNYVNTLYNISYLVDGRGKSKNYQRLHRGNRRGNHKGYPQIDQNIYGFACPELKAEGPNRDKYSCTWMKSTSPQYRESQACFTFLVGANNSFGSKVFHYPWDHYKNVYPNPPENLSALYVTPNLIQLHWLIPLHMQEFRPGLVFRIMYSYERHCENCKENSWTHREITLKNVTTVTYNITDLPYAHYLYDIRVSMRSADYDPENPIWSRNASIVVRTKSTIPTRPPRTTPGSFEIINHENSRDAYIYWQLIKKEEENGQNMTYYVESVEDPTLSAYSKKSLTLFKNLSLSEEYTFKIWSENSEGRSTEYSTVFIPKQFYQLKQPRNFIKVAHSDELYQLTWPDTNQPVENYTVFWCEWTKDRPYQCEGKLNWVEVSNMTTNYNKTLPRTNLTYQFAIAVNYRSNSSGMLWSDCTVIPDRNMGKMKNIWIKRVGSTYIELGWKLDCSIGKIGDGMEGIRSFVIYYCPIQSPTQLDCKGQNSNRKISIPGENLAGANVTGLTPYTTYKLNVAVVLDTNTSSQLSDPLYNSTIEAAPSAPLNLSINEVTTDSIHLTWQKPNYLNGVLREYKVYYNDKSVTVKKTETEILLNDLESFINYTIYVEACTTSCTPSEIVSKRTEISTPGTIPQPKVSFQNGTCVTVVWDPPEPPNGRVDFYEVLVSIQKFKDNNVTEYQIITLNTNKYDIKDCIDSFYIKVRAVNLKEKLELRGEWSEPLEGLCRAPYIAWMYIVFPLIGIVFIIIIVFGSRKAYEKLDEMRNVKYVLPPGIDLITQDLKSTKLRESDNDQNLEDHVLLEKNKAHTNENSSGCSSGNESFTGSLQSGTLNSDSGTEQPRSPSPCDEPATNHSLRQRKMPIAKTTTGYVKADAIPQPNWTKPAVPGNYCVLGMESPGTQEPDSPYVPFTEHIKMPFTPNDANGPPPTLVVANEMKPPASGYLPFNAVQEPPQERNPRYVMAGIPPPKDIPVDLMTTPPEDKNIFVRATPEITLKTGGQLPWIGAPEVPTNPKPGYVCVGDVPRLKHVPDVSVNKGYVPHTKFEVKSLKED